MTFADLLAEFGVAVKRHGESSKVSNGWVGLPCPFCRHVSQDGDANLLGVNLRTGGISCYYCGTHRPGETLAALTGKPLDECIELTRDTRPAGRIPDRPRGVYKEPIYGDVWRPMLSQHGNYLRARGFDPHNLQKLWRIRCIGIHHRLPWRLFIPILYGGEPVSWTTRSISPDVKQRYIGAKPDEEAIPAKSLLYGEDYARHGVIVVEGIPDAWAIGPGAVALLGTGYTRSQVRRLAKYPVRALCMDSAATAQRRGASLADELTPMDGRTYRVQLDSAADPADCLRTAAGRRELTQLRKRFLGG